MTELSDRQSEGDADRPRGPGRPPLMTDQATVNTMLDCACTMLAEAGGLSVSLEHLAFEDLIKRAGVSRSAAYRIWGGKDGFFASLLEHISGPAFQGPAAFDERTLELGAEIVFGRPELLRTQEGRRQLLLEAVRLAALRNFEAIAEDGKWRTYIALSATVESMEPGETRWRIERGLRSAETAFVTRMADFYRWMGEALELRPRPPFTEENAYRSLAVMGASMVEGLALRRLTNPAMTQESMLMDDQEWSLPALGFLAVIDKVFEGTPDDREATDD